jgi:proteasome alpha subunit
MMLSDEPYRWAEAISNRRDYIEDQIRSGSPVVGVGYEDGVLLLTLGQGQQKLFEVYDRIGLAAIGHSTDIEKLRQAAIDMAHSIGFNYSEDDVTLRQIVYFGLGPVMKAGFDDVVRSPFLVRMLLTELDSQDGAQVFYTVDYDGAFYRQEGWAVMGGFPEADQLMGRELSDLDTTSLSIAEAIGGALRAWAIGRWAGKHQEISTDMEELEQKASEVDIESAIKDELGDLEVEAVVLERSQSGKNKYRNLDADEVAPALAPFQAD